MKGRPSVWRRMGRLEATLGEAAVRRMAERVAAGGPEPGPPRRLGEQRTKVGVGEVRASSAFFY